MLTTSIPFILSPSTLLRRALSKGAPCGHGTAQTLDRSGVERLSCQRQYVRVFEFEMGAIECNETPCERHV
jgi:hypothetical protein